MPFGDQIQEPGGLGRLPRDRPPPRPGRAGPAAGPGGAAAGGDRALLQHPGAEPGQGGGRGQGQAQQPQGQAAEDGQRGGRVGGQRACRAAGGGRSPRRGRRRSGCRWPGRRRPGAGPRWPGSASRVRRRSTFMNTLAPTEARFSARARSARRPCRASAMPRQAKTRAAASGIAASRAAMAGRWRVASTMRYWAVKLTAAAAAASTPSPAAALRSHRPERSLGRPGGPGWLPWPGRLTSARTAGRDRARRRPGAGRRPVMSWPVPASGRVTSGIEMVMADRFRGEGGRRGAGRLRRGVAGCRRCGRRLRAAGG